jgi:hypothetical protein
VNKATPTATFSDIKFTTNVYGYWPSSNSYYFCHQYQGAVSNIPTGGAVQTNASTYVIATSLQQIQLIITAFLGFQQGIL